MQALTIEAVSIALPSDNFSTLVNALSCEIEEEAITSVIRPRVLKKIDRFSQIGLIVFEGVKTAMENDDPDKVGLFIGNDLGGWSYVQKQLEDLVATGDVQAINPYVATAWFPAAAQGEISIAHNIRGYSKSMSGGLLSSALAIEHAAQRLYDGTVDLAFAGGVEAPAASVTVDALLAEQRISPEFPASDVGCLFALRRATTTHGLCMRLSKPRRSPIEILDDLEAVWRDADIIDIYLPRVAVSDAIRRGFVAELQQEVAARLGSAVRFKTDHVGNGDFGSAAFAVSLAGVISRLDRDDSEDIPALVFGTDFEGLYLAAAVTQ